MSEWLEDVAFWWQHDEHAALTLWLLLFTAALAVAFYFEEIRK